jgi:hypothetical protein
VNVKTLFQKSLIRNDPLNKESVAKIWMEVTGERIDKIKQTDYIATRTTQGYLDPIALENMLINELVANKVLMSLSPK